MHGPLFPFGFIPLSNQAFESVGPVCVFQADIVAWDYRNDGGRVSDFGLNKPLDQVHGLEWVAFFDVGLCKKEDEGRVEVERGAQHGAVLVGQGEQGPVAEGSKD